MSGRCPKRTLRRRAFFAAWKRRAGIVEELMYLRRNSIELRPDSRTPGTQRNRCVRFLIRTLPVMVRIVRIAKMECPDRPDARPDEGRS